jgi:Superinfection immunity protein
MQTFLLWTFWIVGGFLSCGLLWVVGLYFLPSIIACYRKHCNQGPIFILNLIFGWTILGWIIPLAWSTSKGK